MDIYLQGLALGVVLAIMVGPLTVSLLHTSIEKGPGLGFTVASGIWTSDLLFILAVYFGFRYIEALIQFEHFEPVMGGAGSIILVLIGLGILSKRNQRPGSGDKLRAKDWISAWTLGFMINTVNPFTFIFWSSVMGAVILKNGWTPFEATLFFCGIMTLILVSDSLKVILSSPLQKWLTPDRWRWIKTISGVSFLVFGAILVVRVFFLN
jgi:threonine/homoserine/homoserine lactone efflux protein